MTAFNPQIPFNQLPLLQDCPAFKDKGIERLCKQVSGALRALKNNFSAQLMHSALNALLIKEAAVNANLNYSPDEIGKLARFISLDQIPNEPKLHRAFVYHEVLSTQYYLVHQRRTCTATAIALARQLTADDIGIRHHYGPAIVRGSRQQSLYQPPAGESIIRSRLANWELFLHERVDLHPLVRMAVGLFQFFSISPFHSANLRSAHILSQLYLIDKGILDTPVLNLSTYLLKYRRSYEDLFLQVHQNQAWKEWMEFILKALFHQAQHMHHQLQLFKQLWSTMQEQISQTNISSNTNAVVELLMQRPYCTARHLVDAGIVQRHTASNYLKQLSQQGILTEERAGRQKHYINSALLYLIQFEKPAEPNSWII
jgi:Fic family protein